MFKKGDIIVGLPIASEYYEITSHGSECEVISEQNQWTDGQIRVRILKSGMKRNQIGDKFWVMSKHFTLLEEEN